FPRDRRTAIGMLRLGSLQATPDVRTRSFRATDIQVEDALGRCRSRPRGHAQDPPSFGAILCGRNTAQAGKRASTFRDDLISFTALFNPLCSSAKPPCRRLPTTHGELPGRRFSARANGVESPRPRPCRGQQGPPADILCPIPRSAAVDIQPIINNLTEVAG